MFARFCFFGPGPARPRARHRRDRLPVPRVDRVRGDVRGAFSFRAANTILGEDPVGGLRGEMQERRRELHLDASGRAAPLARRARLFRSGPVFGPAQGVSPERVAHALLRRAAQTLAELQVPTVHALHRRRLVRLGGVFSRGVAGRGGHRGGDRGGGVGGVRLQALVHGVLVQQPLGICALRSGQRGRGRGVRLVIREEIKLGQARPAPVAFRRLLSTFFFRRRPAVSARILRARPLASARVGHGILRRKRVARCTIPFRITRRGLGVEVARREGVQGAREGVRVVPDRAGAPVVPARASPVVRDLADDGAFHLRRGHRGRSTRARLRALVARERRRGDRRDLRAQAPPSPRVRGSGETGSGETREEVQHAVGDGGAVGELAGDQGGVRLRDERHGLAAPSARGHLRGRSRGVEEEGPVGISVCRRRRRWRPVGHAADLRRAVVQALAPADHAPGEAEQDGRRGSGRRHLADAWRASRECYRSGRP